MHKQVRQLALTPPVSYALHAQLTHAIWSAWPKVARCMQGAASGAGQAFAHTALEPGGALAELNEGQQSQLNQQAQELAEVFQRSSSNVEGRNGYLPEESSTSRARSSEKARMSDGDPQLFPHACRRHNRGERFFSQKPRSMFAAILQSVDLPPAPLSPPRRAEG